ncbi:MULTISPECIES: hypothetical protein [unclassified Roseovarius]|uniref:hypothetical protein n=1 Tax=unclassified Roseovarius TaxID=2614913 RepID=UPI00273DFEAB|nr:MULTISPECIES: hypothetical protein [unclassified Roseovarius]
MTLALQSLRLMLIASVLAALLMGVLWLGLGNGAAKPALVTQGINVVACLVFTVLLPKEKTWISVFFALYCGLLLIGSKMGGFTLTTFPVYVMAILSIGGLAGIIRWFSGRAGDGGTG